MRELEIITAAVAADGKRGPRRAKPGVGPKHAVVHTECLNCGAKLEGRFCYDCGQGADDHHRSILHLIWEVVEDFTHFDGRLMQTLPPLFFKPGQLARDHFEGRRQRHVPPLRLFLITLLIFMFCLEVRTTAKPHTVASIPGVHISTDTTHDDDDDKDADAAKPSTAIKAIVKSVVTSDKAPPPAAAAGRPAAPVVTPPTPPPPIEASRAGPVATATARSDVVTAGTTRTTRDLTPADAERGFSQMQKSKFGKSPFGGWLAQHGRAALANKAYFQATMFEWGHRLSILMLPIFAGMLALSYFYKRQFYIYDHLIVSMHFLSFTFLIWAVAYLIPDPVGGLLFIVATIWTPVNLFMTLRGAYGSSILGALVKTFILWTVALALFLTLLLGVIFIAMGSM